MRHSHESEYLELIKMQIIEPAKKFLDSQNCLGKKFHNDFKKVEKEWYNSLANAEKVIEYNLE
jgi:hypothetical protein